MWKWCLYLEVIKWWFHRSIDMKGHTSIPTPHGIHERGIYGQPTKYYWFGFQGQSIPLPPLGLISSVYDGMLPISWLLFFEQPIPVIAHEWTTGMSRKAFNMKRDIALLSNPCYFWGACATTWKHTRTRCFIFQKFDVKAAILKKIWEFDTSPILDPLEEAERKRAPAGYRIQVAEAQYVLDNNAILRVSVYEYISACISKESVVSSPFIIRAR